MILIIENQYLSPIISYKISINCSNTEFEQYEYWQKMSFRNRCTIATANGPLDLSVPLVGGRNVDALVTEVKIDNNQPWQKRHWRSIFSAYNHSPWFEFYRFEMELFFNTRYELLWDWNLALNRWIVEKLGLNVNFSFSHGYHKKIEKSGFLDFRNQILPKTISQFNNYAPRYTQVFEDRIGFIPNLSIIDLLFCEGPRAAELLTKPSLQIAELISND